MARSRPIAPGSGRLWLMLLALALTWQPSASRAATPPAAIAAPGGQLQAPEDPFEGLNRLFYRSWRGTDRAVIRPLAMGYAHTVPQPMQKGLRNVLTEIREPQVFANDMVQFRIEAAGKTVARFLLNATIGVAGLLDPASKIGLPHEDNGFGDTLGRWGVKPGPYVFLPFFGPSDFRDMIGQAVDYLTDPVGWGHYDGDSVVRGVIWVDGGLDQRAQEDSDLQQIESMGTDSYATMRSFYLQSREAEIHGNAQVDINQLPQLDLGPETTPAPTASPPPADQAPAPPPSSSAPSAAAAAAPTSAVVAGPPAPRGASGDAADFMTAPAPHAVSAAGPPIEL